MIHLAYLAITTALGYLEEHPDIAKSLLSEVASLLELHTEEVAVNPEAIRGIMSGLAAARSIAVQEYTRREAAKKVTP